MPETLKVRADWPANQSECTIAIVGDYPDADAVSKGRPFIGRVGWMLDTLLKAAGIDRNQCLLTNVFSERPNSDDLQFNFAKKREAKKLEIKSPYSAHFNYGVLRPEFEPELVRLYRELSRVQPNIVIALGAVALWAMTGLSKIGDIRGVTSEGKLAPPSRTSLSIKVLATYHPATVLAKWAYKPVVTADLIKALDESYTPDVQHTERDIWIHPTIADIIAFDKLVQALPYGSLLTYDIETAHNDITTIGFSISDKLSISIPFVDHSKLGHSYWNTPIREKAVWNYIRSWLGNKALRKLAQNGTYDIMWLARIGIQVRGSIEDTMILHHAMQPELQKGLGFLGSLYTKEQAWKLLGKRKSQTNKQDD